MRSFLFATLIFGPLAFAANGRGISCNTRISEQRAIRDLAINQCEEVKSSAPCKQIYKMIEEDGGDLKSKQLDCQQQVDSSWLSSAKNRVSGCLVDGIFDSTFGVLGRSIGESLAQNDINIEKEKERIADCNKNPQQKKRIFEAYNHSVPQVLKVTPPPEQKLSSSTCEDLEKYLHYTRKSKEKAARLKIEYNRNPKTSSFSKDELEYLAWKENLSSSRNPVKASGTSDQGLLDTAYEKLGEFGVRLECYNAEAAAALSCEALFAVVGGVRLGVMAAASGLKVARLERRISALKELGKEGRIAKATKEIAPLDEAKKLDKLQNEIGRKKAFTEKEVKAYQKAHDEGSARGESYGSYKGDTLREKKRILMEEGGFSEREANYMIYRGYVGYAPVNGEKLIIVDGRVSNLPPGLTADERIKKSMDQIAALDDKVKTQALREADLDQFLRQNQKLYEEVRSKTQTVYEYEPSKLISNHETSLIRIFGRDADYGEDLVTSVSKKGGDIQKALDAEMSDLESQAHKYFDSAKNTDNVLDYYRGKRLMEARKQIGFAAEDRGLSTSVDGMAADDQLSAIRDVLLKDAGLKKKILDLEKHERSQ